MTWTDMYHRHDRLTNVFYLFSKPSSAFKQRHLFCTFRNPNELTTKLPLRRLWRRMLKLTALITNNVTDSFHSRRRQAQWHKIAMLPTCCSTLSLKKKKKNSKADMTTTKQLSFSLKKNNSFPILSKSTQSPF